MGNLQKVFGVDLLGSILKRVFKDELITKIGMIRQL